MEEKKTTFVFHTEWKQYIDNLNLEDKDKLISIICDYVENLKEPNKPNLSDRLLMTWLFIKSQVDKDKTKYDRRCETSKINGKKGGRPKKLNNLNKPKKADNDNEYEYDSDYVDDNDLLNTTTIYSYIEKSFGRTLGPVEFKKIEQWLSLFNEDIIKYAIEIAVLNDVKTFQYTDGILKNWKSCNLKTLQEIKEAESKVKKNNLKINPEWIEKEVQEDTASEEEIKKLEERMKR